MLPVIPPQQNPQNPPPAPEEPASWASAGVALAPPWFAPVQNQLDDMQRVLLTVVVDSARNWNRASGDGIAWPFKAVPFIVDGRTVDPTQAPLNLPPIENLGQLRVMGNEQVDQYLQFYGLPVPHLIEDRKRAIARYIGCFYN